MEIQSDRSWENKRKVNRWLGATLLKALLNIPVTHSVSEITWEGMDEKQRCSGTKIVLRGKDGFFVEGHVVLRGQQCSACDETPST